MWFGSYRRWMFYVFLVAVVVIETSFRYLNELRAESIEDQ